MEVGSDGDENHAASVQNCVAVAIAEWVHESCDAGYVINVGQAVYITRSLDTRHAPIFSMLCSRDHCILELCNLHITLTLHAKCTEQSGRMSVSLPPRHRCLYR